MAEGGGVTAVIDRLYPLENAAMAHAVVDTVHRRGNIVLSVAPLRATGISSKTQ